MSHESPLTPEELERIERNGGAEPHAAMALIAEVRRLRSAVEYWRGEEARYRDLWQATRASLNAAERGKGGGVMADLHVCRECGGVEDCRDTCQWAQPAVTAQQLRGERDTARAQLAALRESVHQVAYSWRMASGDVGGTDRLLRAKAECAGELEAALNQGEQGPAGSSIDEILQRAGCVRCEGIEFKTHADGTWEMSGWVPPPIDPGEHGPSSFVEKIEHFASESVKAPESGAVTSRAATHPFPVLPIDPHDEAIVDKLAAEAIGAGEARRLVSVKALAADLERVKAAVRVLCGLPGFGEVALKALEGEG